MIAADRAETKRKGIMKKEIALLFKTDLAKLE